MQRYSPSSDLAPQNDRGHGPVTTRTIQVLDAPQNLPFPHVSQA